MCTPASPASLGQVGVEVSCGGGGRVACVRPHLALHHWCVHLHYEGNEV